MEFVTTDHTLYRKADVLNGDNNGLDPFMVQLEWDSLPEDDFSGLGWHNCDCFGIENVSFLPQTASICDSFLFNSSTFQVVTGSTIGDLTLYLDAFRIIEIMGLPGDVTAQTDVMATADIDGPYGYWYNSGITPIELHKERCSIASQTTINGLSVGPKQ